MTLYAGIDLGASKLLSVVGDGTGAIVATDRRATPRGPDGEAVTETVLDSLRSACRSADADVRSLGGVGVGSIGPLDLDAGAVRDPVNLPAEIELIRLRSPIETLADTDRVSLVNDTTAAAIGERFHATDGTDDLVFLTVSTGISAGVVVDGHVLRGRDGNAGEVGHTVIDPEGTMRCGCGGRGHWEAYSSGDGIPRYAAHLHAAEGIETTLPLRDPDFSAADVFASADEDALAERVLERVADWNAIGVANLANAYAPSVVSVGGAVALNNPERVIEPMIDRLDGNVISDVPEIRTTDFGDAAVARGALASVLPDGCWLSDGRC